MDEIVLNKAIHLLRPGSEFVFTNGDYSTIQWHKLEGKEPTQSEITAAIKTIETNQAKAETDRIAAKQSAQTKLAALGLTEEEVASILG